MLDTNVCIYIINKKPVSYLHKLTALEQQSHNLIISSITLAELQYGVANSDHQIQNQANLSIFLSRLVVVDYSAKCALYYGELRTQLKREGIMIGSNDLLIASHALAESSTLVTNNMSEFGRISKLVVENWDYIA